ncbi:FecR family protein [Pricia antarctica]|uniref:FecR family protein n=1 Tax=Pricia antarctica TaxID=641691 RepID=A0A1G7FDR3_9FLAO|nr:FecR domain-containing protein [Pricia antarctica]SDE74063.1 FecR family protein [Pricia antarctica]
MLVRDTENRIVKYLLNEATIQDLDFLSDWILVGDNERIFEEFAQSHYEATTVMNEPDKHKIKEVLMRRMKKDKNIFQRQKIRSLLKYAAVGMVFVTLGYIFHENQTKDPVSGLLVPKEEAITITLENGTVETLDPSANKNVMDSQGNIIGNQKRSKLTYSGSTSSFAEYGNSKTLVYNTIKVPYGKRFDVILSDGTHVFLNSGTSLRYPVQFLKGLGRRVFLTGEAYFDVAKDKEHHFTVQADELDIEVLGTKFNVSHYPEDTNINTVLVEGSVEINIKNEKDKSRAGILLEPGFKAEWRKVGDDISIENVDTEIYTAWVQGKLVFRNTPFRKIRQALERKYNITIKNRDKDLDKQLFDATFDIETIEEVLESFNKSYAIYYKINNNKVIID